MTSLRPLHEQEALVFGFCRIHYADDIPDALNTLCFLFLNETHYFHYEQPKLNKFLQENYDKPFGKQIFHINQFIIEIYFYSVKAGKLIEKSTTTFIVPFIKIKPNLNSTNIHSAVISYHFLCFQTKSECKKTVTMQKQKWFDLPDLENKQDHEIEDHEIQFVEKMWDFGYNMASSDCRKFNALHFGININILSIKYMDNKPNNYNPMCPIQTSWALNRKITYEWNIDEQLLNEIKQCKYGKLFYSDNFENDYFCLCVAPNGWNRNNEGKTYLYLNLLKLPIGIEKMDVSYKVYYIDDGSWAYIQTIDLESTITSRISRTMCSYSNILLIPSLRFKVEIEIKNIYNEQNELVDYMKWNKFEITQRDYF